MGVKDSYEFVEIVRTTQDFPSSGPATTTNWAARYPIGVLTSSSTNRNFAARRAAGEIFNNPYSRAEEQRQMMQLGITASSNSTTWRHTNPYLWGTFASHLGNLGTVPIPSQVLDLVQDLKSVAITEAYAGVQTPDISALVSAAELPETIAFLAGIVTKMSGFTNRARAWKTMYERLTAAYQRRLAKYESLPERVKAKRTKPKKPKIPPFKVGKFSARDIPSMWLAYRYGIMPLIYEFQAIQKVLENGFSRPPRETSRAKGEDTLKGVHVVPESKTEYSSRSHTYKTVGDYKIAVRAGVLYAPSVHWTKGLGLTLDRVPAALYELIPLSFVADWFWTGAEAYDALTAECRAQKILASWVSVQIDYVITESNLVSQKPGYSVTGSGGVVSVTTGKLKTRSPASMLDIRVKLRLALNTKRIADGLSLIYLFLTGGRAQK